MGPSRFLFIPLAAIARATIAADEIRRSGAAVVGKISAKDAKRLLLIIGQALGCGGWPCEKRQVRT